MATHSSILAATPNPPKELYNDFHDQGNHDGVITDLEPNIPECEVKWALGSITSNKARGGDGIPTDVEKMLHLICQQIWKTQQWPQDWKRSVFIPIQKKSNAKECSNYSQGKWGWLSPQEVGDPRGKFLSSHSAV